MRYGINRIRLEFKERQQRHFCSVCNSINRIRLEFKDHATGSRVNFIHGINRIRLEFKALSLIHEKRRKRGVLIESDWNLKNI